MKFWEGRQPAGLGNEATEVGEELEAGRALCIFLHSDYEIRQIYLRHVQEPKAGHVPVIRQVAGLHNWSHLQDPVVRSSIPLMFGLISRKTPLDLMQLRL